METVVKTIVLDVIVMKVMKVTTAKKTRMNAPQTTHAKTDDA